MDEKAQKTPLYIKIGEFVFFLLGLLVKLALLLFALAASYLVCFFIWADYVDRYGNPAVIKLLDESARVIVKDQAGIENFQTEKIWVDTPVFDGASGNWKVFLEEPFQYKKPFLRGYDILRKSDIIVIEDEGTSMGGFLATDLPGYTCYFREGVILGNGTVCEDNSIRECHVSVCVKEGERLMYVEVVDF